MMKPTLSRRTFLERTAGTLAAALSGNTGPLPDGAIHAADVKTLTEVGGRI